MERLLVNVAQGTLRGSIVKNVLGGSYIAFKGIPFAAPPIGDLRFKDPTPPIPWSGVRDATKYAGAIAPQISITTPNEIQGDEDCLYLSVHTASLDKVKPVLVWVHGGSFSSGSERFVAPDYLVAKDITVVTLSYRLGVLGFLNLGHEIAAGNQGVKDQVAALRWIKVNIANFGGDPQNITVYGTSAGAATTHLLALSPMSRGLFHKMILQSGTALCSWALRDGEPEHSFRLARNLGNCSEDPQEVFQFLQSVPVKDLIKAQSETVTDYESAILYIPFGPTIDAVAKDPFFPGPVCKFESNADSMPMMLGYTSHEFLIYVESLDEKCLQFIEERLEDFVRLVVPLKDSKEMQELLGEVRNWYFSGKAIDIEQLPAVVQFLGDIRFTTCIKRAADVRRKDTCAPTFVYKFSYIGDEKSWTQHRVKKLPFKGASHVDDSAYLWYIPEYKVDNPDPPAIGTKDRITLERLTRIWANFARTGNPTPCLDEYVDEQWSSVTPHDFYYLDIGDNLQNLSIKNDVFHIYRKYMDSRMKKE